MSSTKASLVRLGGKGFGMYGYGDGKFFPLENADACNTEQKANLADTIPTAVPQ